ncbi:MAG: methionine synthase I (cobalamin-dependent)/5,10-methylenetetrahydrofolate reductase [Planctomycetota bacterium]|jgi:methionine synthase I (cobalamin-dependent)/5,10-methylenetetrahydrofolate reductase
MNMPSHRDFLTELAKRPMAFDGAMGTQLYESGYFINHSFDEANLKKAQSVLDCHRRYVDVGVDVIETNTFSANRFLLARYGIADQVREINKAGVELAREAAAGSSVWVAGSVGPTGEGFTHISDRAASRIMLGFSEQIEALVDAEIDLLVLETFHNLAEMKLALEVARRTYKGAIVAQMSFQTDFTLRDGTEPEEVTKLLGEYGADVVGINCALGPAHVFEIATRMVGCGLPVSAQPNAGEPRRLDERTLYMATPEYFGVFAKRFYKAGVKIVGGCCGTGPDHAKSIVGAARMMSGSSVVLPSRSRIEIAESDPGLDPVPTAEKSQFAAKIRRIWHERFAADGPKKEVKGPEDFAVSVEVNPHPGLNTDKAINGARLLRDAGVDVVNIADGPRAVVRMANWALGLKIMRELDMEFILHVCCRDRNFLGLQADLLGAHTMGIRNLVVITGDPPKLGDYPKASAVFDLDSVELLKVIQSFNRGIDPSGKAIKETTSFFTATGAEPGALDYDRELRRLEQKIRNGADLVMTQPVYDPKVLERFLADTASFEVPVLVGILPLASARNADFLHNEVPGMQIPDHIRKRMHVAADKNTSGAEGVLVAQEMLEAAKNQVVGAYVMPPFSRYQTAIDVLSVIGL